MGNAEKWSKIEIPSGYKASFIGGRIIATNPELPPLTLEEGKWVGLMSEHQPNMEVKEDCNHD